MKKITLYIGDSPLAYPALIGVAVVDCYRLGVVIGGSNRCLRGSNGSNFTVQYDYEP